ncbi:SEPT6 [Cordylochernes scorpioides]|uniref:Septin n=1 Tax=Cordylochernes scorpioides TaxID=51811 RepID=A0ABY6K5X5_9ARAC|nr:SEPT6 [Cordylochernes scorpioides]
MPSEDTTSTEGIASFPPSEGIRTLKVQGSVGFDTLPEQFVRKAISVGFSFNILCIGETGIGKSTLMDSLFNTSLDSTPSQHTLPGVKLRSKSYELQESNVRLKMTLVDTVGYGDQLNREESFKAIVNFIDSQFETFLQEELKMKRSLFNFHDTRIHACLYFICPTGHGLKSIDLVCMKMLDKKVNIIPIIAKADTISKMDLQRFKANIMSELISNGVQIYRFPTDGEEVLGELNQTMNAHLPFAVVGSTEFVTVGNKKVRARQYPWGIVQLENESHCDFVKLREMLIRINMEDLRETTHSRHYETFRQNRLEQMGFTDVNDENQPVSFQDTYEQKRQSHLEDLRRREKEMRQLFVSRVKEREGDIKIAERDLHSKFENMKKQYAEEKKKLEEEKRKLEEEVAAHNKMKIQLTQGSFHGSFHMEDNKLKKKPVPN